MSVRYPDGIDFAVAAYREEGVWQVATLPPEQVRDPESIIMALQRFPGDGGALGLFSVDEDYFVVYRVAGVVVRIFVSDGSAAHDSELAADALDIIDVPIPDENDPTPCGELTIFEDLGYPALDLRLLLEDLEIYPDEALLDIAGRLGFAPQLERVAELTEP